VVTEKFSCVSGGSIIDCQIILVNAGGLNVAVKSTSCTAPDNKIELLSPVNSVLTTNGCQLATGQTWAFPGPYAAGTEVKLRVTSAQLQFPPQLRVTGSYPNWEVSFEDGGDADLNDIVLTVTAT
jgi:hypothetical protein